MTSPIVNLFFPEAPRGQRAVAPNISTLPRTLQICEKFKQIMVPLQTPTRDILHQAPVIPEVIRIDQGFLNDLQMGQRQLSATLALIYPEVHAGHISGVTDHVTGISTPTNFLSIVCAPEIFKNIKAALGSNNPDFIISTLVNTTLWLGLVLGGAAYAPYRVLSVIAALKGLDTSLDATTTLGKAAFATGFAGDMAFTGLLYLPLLISGALGWQRSSSFLSDLEGEKRDAARVQFLFNKIESQGATEEPQSAEEFKELGRAKCEELYQFLLKTFSDHEHPIPGLEEAFKQSVKDARKAIDNVFNKLRHDDATLILVGKQWKAENERSRKESELKNAAGGSIVKRVHEAYNRALHLRLKSWDEVVRTDAENKASALVSDTIAATQSVRWTHRLWVLVGLIGVVSGVLGAVAALVPALAATWPAFVPILIAAALCVLIITMTKLDHDSWIQAMASDSPGKWDKFLTRLTTAILVASIVATVALWIAFSLSPVGCALSLGGALVALGFRIYHYSQLHAQQRVWDEKHPTLDTLLKAQNREEAVQLLSPQDQEILLTTYVARNRDLGELRPAEENETLLKAAIEKTCYAVQAWHVNAPHDPRRQHVAEKVGKVFIAVENAQKAKKLEQLAKEALAHQKTLMEKMREAVNAFIEFVKGHDVPKVNYAVEKDKAQAVFKQAQRDWKKAFGDLPFKDLQDDPLGKKAQDMVYAYYQYLEDLQDKKQLTALLADAKIEKAKRLSATEQLLLSIEQPVAREIVVEAAVMNPLPYQGVKHSKA